MFTQLNQYHVVLEVKPEFQQNPLDLQRSVHPHRHGRAHQRTGIGRFDGQPVFGPSSTSPAGELGQRRVHCHRYRRHGIASSAVFGSASIASNTAFPNGGQVPLSAFIACRNQRPSRSRSTTRASSRWSRCPSISRPNASLGDAVEAVNKVKQDSRHAAQHPGAVPGHGRGVPGFAANEPVLILAALVTVYIVLGVLYESYIHPITILSTLPSAGVGALLALYHLPPGFQRHCADRHCAADRHREEERHHDDRLRAGSRAQGGHEARSTPSIRPACCASARS